MLSNIFRLLAVLSCLSFTAHAASLVAVQSTVLEGDARAQAFSSLPAAAPALPAPLPDTLRSLGSATQGGILYVAAAAPDGATQVFSFVKGAWQTQPLPPAPLVAGSLAPASQAFLIALAHRPDGGAEVVSFSTITRAWASLGQAEIHAPLGRIAPLAEGFLVENGADHNVTHIALVGDKRLLKWIDWAIIAFYLGFTAAIGYHYYRKDKLSKDNADFFLGGRNIPWWAAGVSLYATGTSAISYIASPAYSFATNWLLLANNVVGMVGTIFVATWIVPLIRRLSLMSVYHYLEMRFHPYIRVVASALAIVLQLGGRMSIVLYLPALAMSAVTGINVTHAILIMGTVTILYTALGGMKAVIWTDFIQVVVMLGGAFVAFGYIVTHVGGGLGEMFRVAVADDKFRTFDWDFNLTQATVWGFLMLNILGVLVYPQDQVMMQRVLSTKSDKEASRSVWTLAAIIVPGNLVFFGIGTALYVFYKQHPAHLNPLLATDTTFPQFIAAELPPGITGLIIAGIFAASMSTLSSCINSVATLVSVDFYEKFAQQATQAKSLRLAEITTVVGGLIGIGTALLLAMADIKSALDTSFALGGLLGGGFAGCYALGMFTKRANWQGAMIGVAISIVLTLYAWTQNAVHPVFYILIANFTTIIAGYVASLFFPAPTQSLLGLTIYTPRKTPVVLSAS